jgi:hypothetical protein
MGTADSPAEGRRVDIVSVAPVTYLKIRWSKKLLRRTAPEDVPIESMILPINTSNTQGASAGRCFRPAEYRT